MGYSKVIPFSAVELITYNLIPLPKLMCHIIFESSVYFKPLFFVCLFVCLFVCSLNLPCEN